MWPSNLSANANPTAPPPPSTAPSPRPRIRLALLIPLFLQLTTLVLVFIALMCPNPLGSSDIALMVIRPTDVSQAMNASSNDTAGPVFGNTTSSSSGAVNTSTSTRLPLTDTQHTSTAPSATAAATPASASASASTATGNASTASSGALSRRNAAASSSGLADDPVGSPFASNNSNKSTAAVANNGTTAAAAALPPLTAQSTPPRPATYERLNITAANNTGALPGTAAYAPTSLSYVEYKYGPMGGCYRDEGNARTCAPASLSPNLASVNDQLSDPTHFDVRGLPLRIIQTFPILLLTSLLTIFVLVLFGVPSLLARMSTRYAGFLSPDSPVQKYLAHAQHYALYVRLIVAVLLVIAGVGLRMQVSKAVYAFNAANAARVLPARLIRNDAGVTGDVVVGLKAYTGSSFGCLWAGIVLLLIETYLERRRLRREEAIQQARKDIEGQYGRDVFEMVRNAGAGNAASTAAAETPKAPPQPLAPPPHDEEKARLYRQLQEAAQREMLATQREMQLNRRILQNEQHVLRAPKSKRIPVPNSTVQDCSASAPASVVHPQQYFIYPQPQVNAMHAHAQSYSHAAAPPSLDRTPSYRSGGGGGGGIRRAFDVAVDHHAEHRRHMAEIEEYREWIARRDDCAATGSSSGDDGDDDGGDEGNGQGHYQPWCFAPPRARTPFVSASAPHSRSTTPLPEYFGSSSASVSASEAHAPCVATTSHDGGPFREYAWNDAEAHASTISHAHESPPSPASSAYERSLRIGGYRPGLIGAHDRRGGGLAKLRYVKG